MSKKQLRKFCLSCYLTLFSILQFLSIAYLLGIIDLKNVKHFIYPCVETYYSSKLVIANDSYKFSDDEFCKGDLGTKFTCIFSDKEINSFYNLEHRLDLSSKKYLDSLEKNKVYHTNNINEFNDLNSIRNLITTAKNSIRFISFKIIDNNIYIITSFKPTNSCNSFNTIF